MRVEIIFFTSIEVLIALAEVKRKRSRQVPKDSEEEGVGRNMLKFILSK